VAVTKLEGLGEGGREVYGFETLTLAPIDRTAIDRDLLEPSEIEWIDSYHARVRAELMPLVDDDTATWLAQVTRPLGESIPH
jgi:Xaa-Pro aminopeptidase